MRRSKTEPEIVFKYAVKIPPGNYEAYCRATSKYFDRQFKRWICAVQFDVMTGPLDETPRLTWYLGLGNREQPRAGRRSRYWRAWVQANGGPPKRNDRMSPQIFERRYATVLVADTTKSFDGHVRADESYSVIRDVLEWQTGGRPPCC
jgi:hypothetical protein